MQYARLLLGVSSVLFGAVTLIAKDSDMWQRLAPLHGVAGTIAGWLVAGGMIAGGVAVAIPQMSRAASIVLGIVYGLFVLSCIQGMIAAPRDPGNYVNCFEQLAIVCGALAVYAATERDSARATLPMRIARIALGVCAVSFAWAQVQFLQYTATLVPAWIPPNQVFWTNLTTVAFALAALAMLIDVRAVLAMRLMALMMALFGVIVWVPAIVAHPATLSNWSELGANYLITAATWLVADARNSPANWSRATS